MQLNLTTSNSKLAALLLIAVAWLPGASEAAFETIEPGAYIVDMGVIPQTVGNGLKPYGMVYDLVINNGIPVKWAINPAKFKDGIDFTADGIDYRGSAFIITAQWADVAKPILDNWALQGVVYRGKTVGSFSADIHGDITAFPNSVLDAGKGGIAGGYLETAGIPDTAYAFKEPSQLNACDDVYYMPHADPAWDSHQDLLPYIRDGGGYLWAACHAVSVLEAVQNPLNPAENMQYLATEGVVDFGDHDGGDGVYDNSGAPGDPITQFIGIIDSATENGSEQIYVPYAAGWRSSTKIAVWDDNHPETPGPALNQRVAKLAFGRAFGNPNSGVVVYEGGHNHGGGDPENVAAQRVALNLLLASAIDRVPTVTTNTPADMDALSTVGLNATVSGGDGPYSYQWFSSCGGSFANTFSPITTFTAPNTQTDLDCVLRVRISDFCGRDTFSADVTVVNGLPLADLSIDKTDSADPVATGGDFTYTLTVTNDGPTEAANVVVTDTLPPEVTFVSASPVCTTALPTVTCNFGTVNDGQEVSADITVTAPATETMLSNTATVSSSDPDPDLTNNSVTEPTEVKPATDLAITKTGPTMPVELPNFFDYELTVTNNGPLDATNVEVTDPLPAGVNFTSATGLGWSCYYNEVIRTVVCLRGALASGATAAPITLKVAAVAIGDWDNTASVRSPDFGEPTPLDNSATVSTNIFTTISADLEMKKNVDKDDAGSGDKVVFDFTVTNYGPNDAENVVVTDSDLIATAYESQGLDSGPTLGMASYSSGTGTLTWNIGTLPAGQMASLGWEFKLLVDTTPTPLTNTATVTTTTPDLNPTNDSDSASIEKGIKEADLGVTKIDSADPILPGSTFDYTIRVQNFGPQSIEDLDKPAINPQSPTVTDTLPLGVTFNNVTVLDGGSPTTDFFNCGYDGGSRTVTCVWDASLAGKKKFNNGDFFDIVINATAPSTPGVVSNTASVTYQNTGLRDNNALNDSASESTTIEVVELFADLVLSKNVDKEGASLNENVVFTFTVTNDGPDSASGVILTDPLDAAIYQFDSIDSGPTPPGSVVTYDPVTGITWNIGTLANGASATVDIKAKVLVDTTNNPITNTATVTANEDDPNTVNNTDTVVIEKDTVEVDLSVVKTASANPVDAGDSFTYTVTVENNGPENLDDLANATLVSQVPVLVDTLPPELIFNDIPTAIRIYDGGTTTVATEWGCAYDAGNHEITCTWNAALDNNFEKNTSFDIEIDVTTPLAGGDVANTAAVSYQKLDVVDNDANNDTAVLVTTINPPKADLVITKTVDNAMPDLNDLITFTIQVTNTDPLNPGNVTNVFVADALPDEVSFVSSAGDGVYNSETGVWAAGDIPFGTTVTLTITVSVDMYVDFTNTATIFGLDEEDVNAANNTASVDVMMERADLTIAKLVEGVPSATVDFDTDATYQIIVTNDGPTDATGVSVSESMPAGLVYVSHNAFGNGTFDPGTGIWSGVSVPASAPGNTATLELVATVTDTEVLTNIATITGADQPDPDLDNNSASADVEGIAADIEITKSVTPDEVNPADSVTYTITATNNGPDDATNVVVNDAEPTGITFGTATASQGSFAAGVWTVGDLANGATATLTIPATADTSGTLENIAALASLDQVDPNPNNDDAFANVLSGGRADLFLVKTVSRAAISEGNNTTYTLYLNNFGPDDATAVVVSDPLPPGLTYLSSSPAGVYDAVTGDWNVGTMLNGTAAMLNITVSAPTAGTYVNVATASNSDQGDPDLTSNESQAIVDVYPPGLLVKVSGTVYSDANDNGTLDGAEAGIGDPVWVKLILASNPASVFAVVAADPVTGFYEFDEIANGDYTLIVDDNTDPADVTPTPPVDWALRTPADGSLSITLSMADSAGNDFGLLSLGTDVGGIVWSDANHDGVQDSGEVGIGGVTMILRNTADGSCMGVVTAGDGRYNFTRVSDGEYEIIEAASTALPVASPCTPTEADPAGYISTTTNTRLVTVTGVPVTNQNFGDFAGSVLRGRVIEDSGIGTGTAYDAVQNGTEPPRGGVRIDGTDGIAPTLSTETNGQGEFEFWIPAAAPVFKVFSARDSGWVSVSIATGSTIGTVINADELFFFPVAGTEYDGVVFGDVREVAFAPDHVKTTTAGSTVIHAHTFTAYSPGEVSFGVINESSSPSITGWTNVIYADADCNAELDPGETVISAPVTVDAEPNNQVCIVTKVFAPASAPDGAQYQFTMQAEMEFTGSLAAKIKRERTDLTIISGDGLAITKIASKTTALPGEVIIYTITYRNTSAEPLADIVINDATPAFTNYVNALCGPLPASISACNITQEPAPGATGPVEWTLDNVLLPGQEGVVKYQVRVDN